MTAGTPFEAFTTISVQRDGGVVHLRLERPEKLNAQTHTMWFELRQAGAALEHDPSVRVLLVSGAGRSFSAGLDTAVLAGFLSQTLPPDIAGLSGESLVRRVQESFTWLATAPFPTVAVVAGHALGAGCQLALACDLRIAADDAVFGLLETNWGLMPDLGGTVWLPELVGPARAKELMWLAQRVDAAEALRLGLVNRVVPAADLHEQAGRLAEDLAGRPPLAVAAVKESVRAAGAGLDAALAVAAAGQLRCLGSQDMQEAGAAWAERREPRYTGS